MHFRALSQVNYQGLRHRRPIFYCLLQGHGLEQHGIRCQGQGVWHGTVAMWEGAASIHLTIVTSSFFCGHFALRFLSISVSSALASFCRSIHLCTRPLCRCSGCFPCRARLHLPLSLFTRCPPSQILQINQHTSIEMTWECDSCDREFYSWKAVSQHMTALDHWRWPYECDTCDRRFGSQHAVNSHMNALNHWYASSSSSEEDNDEFECDKCDRTFSSWDGCKQHMSALNHWFTDVCDTCDRRFVNRHALEQHMDAVGHRSSHYCSSCDRHFQNPSDLFQLLNSPIHQRTNTTNAAPAPSVRSTATPKSAPTATSAPSVPIPSIPAIPPSLPSTRS